jgi:1-deoxy-D-xylulose 5-phosphate reductoisomerase
VLKAAADTYSILVIASSETAKGSLEGNATEATAYNAFTGNDLYMLALNASNEAQFTKVTSGSIAAGKAFLKLPSATARTLNVVFDESTGIEAIESVKSVDNKAYNLNGQRVAQPSKGLYIMNGKKVIVK